MQRVCACVIHTVNLLFATGNDNLTLETTFGGYTVKLEKHQL